MDKVLNDQYIYEKEYFINLLVGARLQEITYSETFNLIFSKPINDSKGEQYKWAINKLNLIIDAPFWVGNKEVWEELNKNENGIIEMEDKLLAYELINMRYNNLIEVECVEFSEKYLIILIEGDYLLSIAHCSDSDYSYILEEYTDKNMQDKKMILCQENEFFMHNFPHRT